MALVAVLNQVPIANAWRKKWEPVLEWAHANLIWLVLGSYALAAFAPSPGPRIRDITFGDIRAFTDNTPVTLPMLLLALLLFNAGLGIRLADLRDGSRNLVMSENSILLKTQVDRTVSLGFLRAV